ncbi:hypothetical protein [Candidatus Poriferisodalis sp.]|uniref:hypothetical protein n=1 Tax=Candidatus Poriferisodalis sp. TaxID=3101277 RepID=UPI003B5CBDCD
MTRPITPENRTDGDWEFLARMRAQFDLLAVQEVMSDLGGLLCWGNHEFGQTDAPSGYFTSVSAGWKHSCGLRTDGTAAYFGNNEYGQTDAP